MGRKRKKCKQETRILNQLEIGVYGIFTPRTVYGKSFVTIIPGVL